MKQFKNFARLDSHFGMRLHTLLSIAIFKAYILTDVCHWSILKVCIDATGRAVAQSGSALRWGCRGREFKSRRPDHFFFPQ